MQEEAASISRITQCKDHHILCCAASHNQPAHTGSTNLTHTRDKMWSWILKIWRPVFEKLTPPSKKHRCEKECGTTETVDQKDISGIICEPPLPASSKYECWNITEAFSDVIPLVFNSVHGFQWISQWGRDVGVLQVTRPDPSVSTYPASIFGYFPFCPALQTLCNYVIIMLHLSN